MSHHGLLCSLLIVAAMISLLLTGCYRMPRDEEYSLIPVTNNPDVVGNRGGSQWMPGAGF